MKQLVNYIEHHKKVNLKMCELNLNATHISLYNALFLIWNECGYDTELSVNRNDVMKLSKIGSANTYTKCLKDLDKLKLLKYKPSFNPLIGSKINLYRFDKGSDKGSVKSSSKGSGNGSGNGSDTLYKLLNDKTIKLLNNNVTLVNANLKDWINSFIETKSEFDYDEVLNIFNSVCVKLPKIKKISPARKKLIDERAKEYNLETIGLVLTKVSESSFLNGVNSNGWTANFDWIFKTNNFIKILEDNYKNKDQQKEIKIGRQTLSTIEQNSKGW